jgi:hypothetical protein
MSVWDGQLLVSISVVSEHFWIFWIFCEFSENRTLICDGLDSQFFFHASLNLNEETASYDFGLFTAPEKFIYCEM